MRKIILVLVLLMCTFTHAQIKVVKNERLAKVGKNRSGSVVLYKKKNQYTFNYQDINTSHLNTFRSFSFKNVNDDLDQLYKIISEGFISMPEENVILELPNDIIELHFARNYGQITMQFIQSINKSQKFIGKSQYLTKKEIDKLFGIKTPKKKNKEK